MIKNVLAFCLFASLAVAGRAALAHPAPSEAQRGGIELGLRLGYGVPLGDHGRVAAVPMNTTLSHWINGQIPIWVDLGYRIIPSLYVGLYSQYGVGFVNTANVAPCSGGTSCSMGDIRIGGNITYHIMPSRPFHPWLGLGGGYEWLVLAQTATAGGTLTTTSKGPEFVNLQAGGDMVIARTISVGPFVSFSMGEFSVVTASAPLPPSQNIVDRSVHEWLVFGVRGILDIHL
jgi:hypothetical protein